MKNFNFLTRIDWVRKKATVTIIAICVVLWVGQILPGSELTQYLFFAPLLAGAEPWRMITAGFLHDPSSPIHILLNMYSIYIFGSVLEPLLGRARFVALYLISILGGSVAVLYLADPYSPVVGASGAFYGLMAAYFVMLRNLGGQSNQLLTLIGINLVLSFTVPGISWQGHIGGLFAGGAIASLYANTRGIKQQNTQKIGLVVIATIFIALAIYKVNNF